jgi:hypothetical protein
MPKCQSGAANYDDNFRYCPYCGTAKPNPQVVVMQGADPRLYEEGVLRLRCILEKQVIGSYKGWLGKTKVEQQTVSIDQIELVALSHEKGEYVALTSATFRKLMPVDHESIKGSYLGRNNYREYLEEPLKNAHDYVERGHQYDRGNNEYVNMRQVFFETLYRELKSAWESFCASLRNDGWFGITEEAIRRSPPVGVLGRYPDGWDDIKPKDPYKEPFYNYSAILKRYRYRRQV